MTERRPSVFLERKAYRRRRLADAARLLPVLGAVALSLPLLWASGGAGEISTTYVIRFVFGAWVMLIVIAFILSRHLPQQQEETALDAPALASPGPGAASPADTLDEALPRSASEAVR